MKRRDNVAARAAMFLEARERSTDMAFLPDEEARLDCWSAWQGEEPPEPDRRPDDHSPKRVLWEVGLALAIPLAFAALVTMFIPVP
jgi:hypothetical protein